MSAAAAIARLTVTVLSDFGDALVADGLASACRRSVWPIDGSCGPPSVRRKKCGNPVDGLWCDRWVRQRWMWTRARCCRNLSIRSARTLTKIRRLAVSGDAVRASIRVGAVWPTDFAVELRLVHAPQSIVPGGAATSAAEPAGRSLPENPTCAGAAAPFQPHQENEGSQRLVGRHERAVPRASRGRRRP